MKMFEAASRETVLESGGFVKGVAVAIVTQNHDPKQSNDPNRQCAVKVRYPWHSQPENSYWARVAVPMAGKDRGTFLLPEVGDEVLVAFERENLCFPYVVGCLWNGKDNPPESNKNGKNDIRLIKTRKGHTLLFDDNSAKGRIELKLNDGKKLTIDDDGITLDDGSGNSLAIDSKGGSVTLKASSTLTLKAPSISLEASNQLSLSGTANVIVRGGMVNIN